jgi:putative redox protein
MVEMEGVYLGDLRCRIRHGPSGQAIDTDAPKDNEGQGRTFSPTDLVGAALGTCVLTVMGIVARRHRIDMTGARVRVEKEMASRPTRRIRSLRLTVTLPRRYPPKQRALLKRAGAACPIHHSLHPRVRALVRFVYP